RARRGFATELGLEPGEQLSRLQTRMLEQEATLLLVPSGDGVASVGGPGGQTRPARPAPASSLPRAATTLIGREPELAILQRLLTDEDVRVVTLIGTGGVGKTRLCLQLARRLEAEYRDGAVLVRLERLTDPGLVTAEIATALGHRDGTDGPGADGLSGYLR